MGNNSDSREDTKLTHDLIVGFENKPLTLCYAHSVLQVMFHHPVFVDIISNSLVKPGGLTQQLRNLYKAMLNKKQKESISTTKIMAYIEKKSGIFERSMQQDSHQFYIWMMNTINDEIKDGDKKKVTSLQQEFYSKRITRTKCSKCQKITQREEEQVDLSLILPQPNVSLNHCINHYSSPQKMTGHDKFECDNCKGLQNAEKSTLIRTLPNFLSVHLRRFKYDEIRKGIVKLLWLIPFPQKIKIKTNDKKDSQDERLYRLVGAIAHIGKDGSFGHYISYIKIGKKWYIFNDDEIKEIEDFQLESLWGYKGSTKCSYMLFYTL